MFTRAASSGYMERKPNERAVPCENASMPSFSTPVERSTYYHLFKTLYVVQQILEAVAEAVVVP